jgi:hypothetical protein
MTRGHLRTPLHILWGATALWLGACAYEGPSLWMDEDSASQPGQATCGAAGQACCSSGTACTGGLPCVSSRCGNGFATCKEVLLCASKCNEVSTCISTCFSAAISSAQQNFQALIQCAQQSGCDPKQDSDDYGACLVQECPNEVKACSS